ncbi:hypothetical protein N7447_007118 [Penicillium robsamsonii]|uniref:uncharacterized protein n=1 Tax=Penicillium robsamsonii TaxID=1792511 RepID=UPI0025495F25|nr:uncharacterized protein N7447_007118 [Penicillium robsamsonii]KAJ5824778.1 hypothetical protein N7447_007118 [Penicillium robsamsonii]
MKFQRKAARSLGIVYLVFTCCKGTKPTTTLAEGRTDWSIRRWLQCSQGETVCVKTDAVVSISEP